MQKVLFARVGNMDYYQGAADEKPIGGGKYNEENIGYEASANREERYQSR